MGKSFSKNRKKKEPSKSNMYMWRQTPKLDVNEHSDEPLYQELCYTKACVAKRKREELGRPNSNVTAKSFEKSSTSNSLKRHLQPQFYSVTEGGMQTYNDSGHCSQRSEVYNSSNRSKSDSLYGRVVPDADLEMGEVQPWNFDYLYQEGELFYDVKHLRRGYCLIFNVECVGTNVRAGTHVDEKRLHRSFRHIGFTVEVKTNPAKNDILNAMHVYSLHDHSNDDCFVCVILSHGRDGHIRSTLDEEVSLHEIMDPIKKCRSLLGKPKLFFVQACRGTNTDQGIMTDAVGDMNNMEMKKLSSHIDVLVSYATVEDHVAYRNCRDGSIYIKILSELLYRDGFTTKLTDLLSKVTDMTSKSLVNVFQVPCYTSTLTKSLLFTPRKRVVKNTVHYDDGTTEVFFPESAPYFPQY